MQKVKKVGAQNVAHVTMQWLDIINDSEMITLQKAIGNV